MGKADRKDEAYLNHIRGQRCLVCRIHPGEAHHLLRTGDRGIGMRSSDKWAVPLCNRCHKNLHKAGDEKLYFAIVGIDAYEWAERSWEEWSQR